jgi:hypothetical protein
VRLASPAWCVIISTVTSLPLGMTRRGFSDSLHHMGREEAAVVELLDERCCCSTRTLIKEEELAVIPWFYQGMLQIELLSITLKVGPTCIMSQHAHCWHC